MPARDFSVSPGSRPGVTLIELLVVMGIMLTLMTLGIQAFSRANRVNRLTATRDLVADAVRQARTTARATGRPVQLRVTELRDASNAVTGGTIQGLIQNLLFSTGFETPAPSDVPIPPKFRIPGGFQGQGFVMSPTQVYTLMDDRPKLEPRSMIRAQDGFRLSIAVRAGPPGSGGILPLVMLSGSAQGAPAVDNAANTIAGLRLVAVNLALFPPAPVTAPVGIDGSPTPPPWNPSSSAWMLQGWIIRSGRPPDLISEWLWPKDTTLNPWSSTFSQRDAARLRLAADGGATWTEVGLLWDGERLALERNGQVVAVRDLGTGPGLVRYEEQHLIFGHATFPDWGDELSGNGADPWAWSAGTPSIPASSVVLDNAELDRLGQGEAHRLPPGVVPDGASTLFFWPDGRVTKGLEHQTTTTDATLKFRGVAEDQSTGVELRISPTTGAVTSVIVNTRP